MQRTAERSLSGGTAQHFECQPRASDTHKSLLWFSPLSRGLEPQYRASPKTPKFRARPRRRANTPKNINRKTLPPEWAARVFEYNPLPPVSLDLETLRFIGG
ncbi:hypothetical protein CMUS01_05054 [Colletotrichum musicola]|uniref:Uncharacterized protein n=1 Tax=Colletotrichum musicola TaxID=2175873 RepID=A0A8H6KTE6_9PEZI|nr:hypothetical protein CMUS01_05054 [Colletotrichum musicola]